APMPVEAGLYKAFAIAGGELSNPTYFEVRNECMPPIECGPVPIRVASGASLLRPGDPRTVTVEQATPGGRLSVVRQRFSGRDWQTVEERELGAADGTGRLIALDTAPEPGLYRDVVSDLERGLSSDALLYE